jgi:hypothetical protein
MKNDLSKFPKYWICFAENEEQVKMLLDFLQENYYDNNCCDITSKINFYIGYDGNIKSIIDYYRSKNDFENNPVEITFEQFLEYSNSTDFLPKFGDDIWSKEDKSYIGKISLISYFITYDITTICISHTNFIETYTKVKPKEKIKISLNDISEKFGLNLEDFEIF